VREIRGGGRSNIIPDSAEFRLNVRINPGVTTPQVIEQLRAAAAAYDGSLEVLEATEAFETPLDSPLVSELASAVRDVLGTEAAFTRMPAWTDAHSFVELGGSEAVVFGPGHLRNAHRPDEKIELAAVVNCARVYASLLARSGSLTAT
jgi:acetylornithine deacetylase/succinyl-diaminopimelate desuccinylase-like protein